MAFCGVRGASGSLRRLGDSEGCPRQAKELLKVVVLRQGGNASFLPFPKLLERQWGLCDEPREVAGKVRVGRGPLSLHLLLVQQVGKG